MFSTNQPTATFRAEEIKAMSDELLTRVRLMSVRERSAFIEGLLLPHYIANRIVDDNPHLDFGEASALSLGYLAEALNPILERYEAPSTADNIEPVYPA